MSAQRGRLMLEFTKTKKDDVLAYAPFFAEQRTHVSDFSLCFQFMWHKYFAPDYAIVEDCLVLKELYAGKYYFHYPLSRTGDAGAQLRAVAALEEYCRDAEIRLHFTNVPREFVPELVLRYGQDVSVTNIRRWRDYLYTAESFRTYAGGKYSGQRNHVNKFKKNYPDWQFRVYDAADEGALLSFLHEYDAAQRAKGSYLASEEMDEVYELVPVIGRFGLLCGYLTAGGKIVACSIGERCGDMIVVHVEKALREYEGVYPATAQAFARMFALDGVRYINREDDSGDAGLRKSKLQYNPVALVDKFNCYPHRAIDSVARLPSVRYERIEIKEITDMYSNAFYRLEFDEQRNKYWGYNWREHCNEEPTPEYFMRGIREDFSSKEEIPLGIYFQGVLAGEVVLHNFGFRNDCEIGVRLLPEYEGMGLAKEALLGLMRYAFFELDIETVLAKCYKQNVRSRNTLLSAGMKQTGEDDTFFYFKKTAAM